MDISPLFVDRLEGIRALLAEPELHRQFELLARPGGLEDELSDPHFDRECSRLARRNGEDAGFATVFVLPRSGSESCWSMIWLGVGERFRRQGVGSAMLEDCSSALARRAGGAVDEICISAWLPNGAAEGFAARHGFREARRFWLMERPLGTPKATEWPAGVRVESFDGSDRAFEDLNAVYNESFAEHWRFVPSTVEDCRALARMSLFDPAGVWLAYRGGRCVGFCRSALLGEAGEVAVLGVVPEARGVGLGRALLRAGVRWLEERAAPRVTLRVDGENETALSLYRGEGFEVASTRVVWERKTSTCPATG